MRLHHLLELQALNDTDAAPAVKEMMAVSILSGIAPEELKRLSAAEYGPMRESLTFLQDALPKHKGIIKEVELNGRTYTVCRKMENFSTGQYIDWCTYMNGDRNLIDLYSVMVIPKGCNYAEGYDLDEAKADIANLPLEVADYISDFWQTSLRIFLRLSAREIRKEVRKLRRMRHLTTEQKEKVRELETMSKELQYQFDIGGTASRRYAAPTA